jgi:hypothetical protein
VRRIAAITANSMAAVACGGSGRSALYTSAASKSCLVGNGLRVVAVSTAKDFIASTATGGSFGVTLSTNRVTVSFGETQEDADNIDQAYRRASARNVGIDDVLYQQANAVMLWHLHPSGDDTATITGCLKG